MHLRFIQVHVIGVNMKHHDLKLFTKYFQHVIDGNKKSELRYDDRGYQIGDVITLHEGCPAINKEGFEYTGRNISARISYIDDFGCQHGYVNLSLSDVGLLVANDLPEILKEQA